MKKRVFLLFFVLLADAKNFDGYVKLGFEHTSGSGNDLALGTKLGYISDTFYNLNFALSLYSSTALKKGKEQAVAFFDSQNKSYAILADAYLQGDWNNTTVKIGRQALETPFANSDDCGMIPNRFEALSIENKTPFNTTLNLAYIRKMAGVDAQIPQKFSNINGKRGVLALGANYEGFENLDIALWYYNLNKNRVDNIYYIQTDYENSFKNFDYSFSLQYAKEHYKKNFAADVYGASASLGYRGVDFYASYNKSSKANAYNGFGGGPFFTTAEQLSIAQANSNAKAYLYGIEYENSFLKEHKINLYVDRLILHSEEKRKANEYDFGLVYKREKNIEFSIVHSLVDDKINEDKLQNTRAFFKYKF